MDLNKVMLIGRATNNLQQKMIESSNTPVVNFTVATNRKFKSKDGNLMEDAEYHRCVAYGKGAEVLGKYLTKGKRIYLEGRLRTRKWQDTEGKDKYSTEIIVDNFIFLDSKGSENYDDNDNNDNRNEYKDGGSSEQDKSEDEKKDNDSETKPEDGEVPF